MTEIPQAFAPAVARIGHSCLKARATASKQLEICGQPRAVRLLSASRSARDATELLSALRQVFRREHSAGQVTIMFSTVVLSEIGTSEILTGEQRRFLLALCSLVEDERPVPGVLWADFVRRHLHEPVAVAAVLQSCVDNEQRIEERIEAVAHGNARVMAPQLKSIALFGDSSALVSVVLGLATGGSGLDVVTPLHWASDRDEADGERFAARLRLRPEIRVEVKRDEEALASAALTDLALLGCRAVARRMTGELEVVAAPGADKFVETAAEHGVPVVLVAGTFKLWPVRTYERYRPAILTDESHTIVDGEYLSWFVTEEGLFGRDGLLEEYDNLFLTSGIPLAAVRDALAPDGGRFSEMRRDMDASTEYLDKIEAETSILERTEATGNLPSHYRSARHYYWTVLQTDDEWMDAHVGKYVLIVGSAFCDEDASFHELATRARKKWGYGPLFMPRVTRGARRELLRPRAMS